MMLSEGVQALVSEQKCLWLSDLMFSHHIAGPACSVEPIIFWTIEAAPGGGVVATATQGGKCDQPEVELARQVVEFTDLDLSILPLRFYGQRHGGTYNLILPEEY